MEKRTSKTLEIKQWKWFWRRLDREVHLFIESMRLLFTSMLLPALHTSAHAAHYTVWSRTRGPRAQRKGRRRRRVHARFDAVNLPHFPSKDVAFVSGCVFKHALDSRPVRMSRAQWCGFFSRPEKVSHRPLVSFSL